MRFAHRLMFFLMTASVLLLATCWTADAAPADLIHTTPEVAYNDPSFRSNICEFLCTKDPPEGGNFCNCDRHPLG